MIKGCSNHGCVVRGTTSGQYTNGICSCVQYKIRQGERLIEINGQKVGPGYVIDDYGKVCDMRIVCEWLKDGGLRDILKLAEAEPGCTDHQKGLASVKANTLPQSGCTRHIANADDSWSVGQ